MNSTFKRTALALMIAACAAAVAAEPIGGIGIQFDRMPVGTKAYYDSTDNGKWLDVYKGKKRGLYVMKRYKGHTTRGRLLQTLYFDAKGRRVYWTGRKGYKVVFKPFDCDYHFGKCNYSYRVNAENYENDGQGRDFVQNTVKKGNQYVATWLVGGDKDRKGGQLFSLGKYNLRTKLQYFNKGMQTVDLVKVE